MVKLVRIFIKKIISVSEILFHLNFLFSFISLKKLLKHLITELNHEIKELFGNLFLHNFETVFSVKLFLKEHVRVLCNRWFPQFRATICVREEGPNLTRKKHTIRQIKLTEVLNFVPLTTQKKTSLLFSYMILILNSGKSVTIFDIFFNNEEI